MFYELMHNHLTNIENNLSHLKEQLSHYPNGNLHYSHNGPYIKWYHSDSGKRTYIPKKDTSTLQILAAKKYLSLHYNELLHEKQALDLYFKHYSPSNEADSLLSDHSIYQPLLLPFFTIKSDKLRSWSSAHYEKNPAYPGQLIHKTFSGNFVRSKSEVLIDAVLSMNQIPFRYECKLQLDDFVFYPDFTIMHPITNEIYYWEHFGMIDNPDYLHKSQTKLGIYINHKIYPSINLITTYETKSHPLNPEYVNTLVHHYFL